MRIEDNNIYSKKEFEDFYPNISSRLIDKTLLELSKEGNFLIFPNNLTKSDDLENTSKIIETVNDNIKINNIIGFIGHRNEQLEMHSRFSQGNKDYFLHYMLQKILHINIVDLNTKLSMKDQLYQLLIYMFPRYLNEAMRKGMIKQYKRFEYNDSNIKGSINIDRHIKSNSPFIGKIAYSTREFTQDNELMQLIRHTIEFIRLSAKNGYMILNSSEMTKQNVDAIIQATPSYNPSKKRKVIISNRTSPIKHAYYTEYLMLQRLCLMILTRRNHSLGGESNNIHGILFDIAWLWEEYLNTILKDNFTHSKNKQGKDGISLFSERTRTVFPDFYNQEHRFVIDAKYKKLELTAKGISREDLYQIVTYSYILKAKRAGVVFPSNGDTKYNKIGILSGYGAEVFKHSFHIPSKVNTYRDFVLDIKNSEDIFNNNVISLLFKKY